MVKIMPTARPVNGKSTVFTTLYGCVTKSWHRCQIGHRSQYSVERLLAFRDYYERTSVTRAAAVCVLMPIPAVLVAILIDSVPLTSPADGWQANSALWGRLLLDAFAISMGVTAQVREVLVTGTISSAGAIAISDGSSVTYVSLAIALAATWHFPIPFGYILLVGPYVILFWVFAIAVIGPRLIIESEVIRQQIKALLLVIAAQGIVAVSYPVFTAVFYRHSEVEQTFFILVMPLIKLVTKQIIAHAAESLHEYVGPIVVFSVDVFNVFYVAICMQISKSTLTTVLMVASDGFHVFIALRSIFRQADTKFETHSYLRDLPDKVWSVFEDQKLANICGCRIRVFAPFPLPLSDESITFMNRIARTRRESHIYSSSRLGTSRNSRIDSSATSQPGLKQTQVVPVSRTPKLNSESRHDDKLTSRKISAAKKVLAVLRLSSRTSSDGVLRGISTQRATEKAVWDALQALFHAEYLLLAEYIECALPLLYAAYLSVLFHLPVASWYPQTASLAPEKLTATVISIILFAVIEFAGFVGLLVLLKRKFGISPLHQLAFVLETQARTLQGHLFVWTIFILHLPLVHYGVDFDIQLG